MEYSLHGNNNNFRSYPKLTITFDFKQNIYNYEIFTTYEA